MKKCLTSELVTEHINQFINGINSLSFYLGNEELPTGILKIQELISSDSIVPIPQAPTPICGLLSVQREILTSIHLKQGLDFPVYVNAEYCCIILFVNGVVILGQLAGRVTIVRAINQHCVELSPSFCMVCNSEDLTAIDEMKDTAIVPNSSYLSNCAIAYQL